MTRPALTAYVRCPRAGGLRRTGGKMDSKHEIVPFAFEGQTFRTV